jgi:hypothetical protein
MESHAVNPGGQQRPSLKARNFSEDQAKDFLAYILALVPVADDPADEAKDPGVVLVQQRGKSPLVSPKDAIEQLSVVFLVVRLLQGLFIIPRDLGVANESRWTLNAADPTP